MCYSVLVTKWVHRIDRKSIDADGKTAICSNCGPVKLSSGKCYIAHSERMMRYWVAKWKEAQKDQSIIRFEREMAQTKLPVEELRRRLAAGLI